MGFLAPSLLILGAAIAVPIVLHLFQRHQGPRVVFPALRYLRRAETEHARRIRLRQWLLMLLRVAVLLLLAVAAARPFLRAAGAGHEPTAVAIVLDNSMSSGLVVGDRRVLDELKDRALETLERAGPEDRFWLIRAGQSWEPALPGDAAATRLRVRETEPTAAAADLAEAIAHARAVLDAGAGPLAREIHVLSDLQATNFSGGSIPAEESAPPLVVWHPRGDPPANTSVTEVAVGGGAHPTSGQRSTVTARIAQSPPAGTADSIAVRLSIDDRLIAVAVGAPGDAVVLPFPARNAGIATGWVTTDPDPLRADDRRAFAFQVRPPPAVATGGSLGLAEQALAVLEEAGRIRRGAAAEADVLILPAARGLESVPAGRAVVIVAPDSMLDLPAVNRRLDAAGIAWRLEPAPQTGEARFDTGSMRDELMRTLAAVRVTNAFQLVPPATPTDSVLLRLVDGSAWAVRGERRGGGAWLLVASGLGEAASTLPASAAMIPLMDRMITSWTAPADAATELAPGDEIVIPAGTETVERPDGTIEPVMAGTPFRLGHEAGLYLLRAADSVRAVLAVNPPGSESDLARLPPRRLQQQFTGWAVVQTDRPGEWVDRIYRGRVGREIWRLAVLAALALLAIEILIAASGATRGGAVRARARPADLAVPAPSLD